MGVRVSIQNVDRGDSLPRRRHRVHADFRKIRPVSVTDPVAVHQNYICHWEGRIIDPILDPKRGAEFSELVVEESCESVGHISGPGTFMRSTEITHEVIP